MDASMILGLGLAGMIVLLSGGKRAGSEASLNKGNTAEFVVKVGEGEIEISPKNKPS